MLEKLYKMIWTRVGGRPWTEIIREDQKQEPLVYLLIFLLIGIGLIKLTQHYKVALWIPLLALGIGILCGHFWW